MARLGQLDNRWSAKCDEIDTIHYELATGSCGNADTGRPLSHREMRGNLQHYAYRDAAGRANGQRVNDFPRKWLLDVKRFV